MTLGRNRATNLPQYRCAILAVATGFPARTPSRSVENELSSLDFMVDSSDFARYVRRQRAIQFTSSGVVISGLTNTTQFSEKLRAGSRKIAFC
jgi:hypothetical protein